MRWCTSHMERISVLAVPPRSRGHHCLVALIVISCSTGTTSDVSYRLIPASAEEVVVMIVHGPRHLLVRLVIPDVLVMAKTTATATTAAAAVTRRNAKTRSKQTQCRNIKTTKMKEKRKRLLLANARHSQSSAPVVYILSSSSTEVAVFVCTLGTPLARSSPGTPTPNKNKTVHTAHSKGDNTLAQDGIWKGRHGQQGQLCTRVQKQCSPQTVCV